ncbi:hypothetical protein B0H10DRAFT_2239962 [Mycena sp. CBHHK59/15]|nr:hypothetical protein B0H10DRAFT_2239962 [Mycena sp. CBHHK59/15]
MVSVPGFLTELVNPTTVDASIRLGDKTASQALGLGAISEVATNIDRVQEDALRDEMAGRTGATDSEPEEDDS